MVADTPEDGHVTVHDFPIVRHPDFNASKDRVRFQDRLTALNLGVPQVDLASSEDSRALRALEIGS